MRNLIFLLIIALVIFIGLAPWVDGYLFKRNYLHLIDIINQEGRAKIDVLTYERGWIRSHAKLRISEARFASNPNAPSLELENHIDHGPIVRDPINGGISTGLATIQSIINFSDTTKRFFDKNLNPESGIEINTLATFFGKWFNKLQIKPLVIAKPYIGKLTWAGLNGNIDLSANGNKIKSFKIMLSFGSFLIEADIDNPYFKKFSIPSITYEKDGHRLPSDLFIGNAKMIIPNVTVTLANGSTIVVSNFESKAQGLQGSTPGTLNTQLDFTLKSFELPSNLDFIPSISNLALKLNFDNLNEQGTKELVVYLKTLRTNKITNADVTKYDTLLAKILTPTTAVRQSLVFNSSLGPFQNNSKMTWPPNTVFNTPMDIFFKSNLAVNLRIAIPLANKLISNYIDRSIKKMQARMPKDEGPSRKDMVNAAKEIFNQVVADLFQQNKITMSQSMQIIGMGDETPDVFANNLQALSLAPDVAAQINQAYQQYQSRLANIASTPTPEQAEQQTIAMQKQTQTSMIKQTLDSLVSQGYITVENDNYIASILYQNQNLTINGKPFTRDMIKPGPVNIGPVLPSTTQPQPAQPVTPQPTQSVPQPSEPVTPQPSQPMTPQPSQTVLPQPGQSEIPNPTQPITPQPMQPLT